MSRQVILTHFVHKITIEPGDMLRGAFAQHVDEQVDPEQFGYVITGQLHADGKNI